MKKLVLRVNGFHDSNACEEIENAKRIIEMSGDEWEKTLEDDNITIVFGNQVVPFNMFICPMTYETVTECLGKIVCYLIEEVEPELMKHKYYRDLFNRYSEQYGYKNEW